MPNHFALVLWFALSICIGPRTWAADTRPLEGFVEVNGVRLQYLDWGGRGPALVLVSGLGADAHGYDSTAPKMTQFFHVISYSRRGLGTSDEKGPFDISTLTEDLLGLMDALGISKAHLVGTSGGGDEITEMAAKHPERVQRIVYWDAAYDWSDPAFHAAYDALPFKAFEHPPSSATQSLDAYRTWQRSRNPDQSDDDLERMIREDVIIERDGTVRNRTEKTVAGYYNALWTNKRRDYTHVHCPALAIYAEAGLDVSDPNPVRRQQAISFQRQYWDSFQRLSIDKVRRELAHVTVIRVPGSHQTFINGNVVDVTCDFLRSASVDPSK